VVVVGTAVVVGPAVVVDVVAVGTAVVVGPAVVVDVVVVGPTVVVDVVAVGTAVVVVLGGKGMASMDSPRASFSATWACLVPGPYQPSASTPRTVWSSTAS
jgi:hypothetical protein